jgi:hypothetical protein
MVISFDLDDTLVSLYPEFQISKGHFLTAFAAKENLRLGTYELFKLLRKRNHKIYIYTTSLRSKLYIRRLFILHGLWPDKIINKQVHDRCLGNQRNIASKLPNRFGIDLHIDDSEGVEKEGKQFGFTTLIIHPLDENWIEKILTHIS